MSCVICHMSCVICHVSRVRCQVSGVRCQVSHFFLLRLSLLGEGLLSTGPTPSSFPFIWLSGSLVLNSSCVSGTKFLHQLPLLLWDTKHPRPAPHILHCKLLYNGQNTRLLNPPLLYTTLPCTLPLPSTLLLYYSCNPLNRVSKSCDCCIWLMRIYCLVLHKMCPMLILCAAKLQKITRRWQK